MDFYTQITRYRNEGESDTAFAARIGVSKQRLSLWKKSTPRIEALLMAAESLGIKPSLLFKGIMKEGKEESN